MDFLGRRYFEMETSEENEGIEVLDLLGSNN
jgi:hypothetical protein